MARRKRKALYGCDRKSLYETRHYPGTTVKITDPFFVMRCPGCGWTCWTTTGAMTLCQKCGEEMEKEKTGT